jgi:hypothetical protein
VGLFEWVQWSLNIKGGRSGGGEGWPDPTTSCGNRDTARADPEQVWAVQSHRAPEVKEPHMGCKIRDFAYGYSAVLFIMLPWITKRTEEEETERYLGFVQCSSLS